MAALNVVGTGKMSNSTVTKFHIDGSCRPDIPAGRLHGKTVDLLNVPAEVTHNVYAVGVERLEVIVFRI